MKLPPIARKIASRIVRSIPLLRRQLLVSTDYRQLRGVREARDLMGAGSGWFSGRTVRRQERAYRGLIDAMKDGEVRLDLRIAADAVAETGLVEPRLIEIGCGSGYYSEVFAHLLPRGIHYTGIDYSAAMVAKASEQYPAAQFAVADATALPYADRSFDIVFNGVSLMHIIDYEKAIREAARVAASYCILHSVPVFDDRQPTVFLQKYAYGAPVVEMVFDRHELMAACEGAGMRLLRVWQSIPYDVAPVIGHKSHSETYLFSVT
jgi:SAM-dependent methyltransferase